MEITDFADWKNFLEKYEIIYEIESTDTHDAILIYAAEDNNIRGYSGFFVEIRFTKEGDFGSFGVWE